MNSAHGGIPVSVVEAAAEWLVRLDGGSADPAAFEAWQQASPEHARAVQSLQGMLGQLQQLPASPARAALRAARRSRKPGIAGVLALIGVLALPGWLVWQVAPPAYLFADLRTGTAEWRSQRLQDGSLLHLNGRTAVDLQFDDQQRRVHLVQGEILVDVAADANRPFVIDTEHGQIRALGTRFIVEKRADSTRLIMLESKTAVSARQQPLREVQVAAGQQTRITHAGLEAPGNLDIRGLEQAWQERQLVVQDRPLPEVLDELARHHSGYLRFDAERLQHLRVSAVLPLDDSPRALRLLAQSFALQVEQFTPWLTEVSLKQAPKK